MAEAIPLLRSYFEEYGFAAQVLHRAFEPDICGRAASSGHECDGGCGARSVSSSLELEASKSPAVLKGDPGWKWPAILEFHMKNV
ncbi:hypothetical protein [Bradyrhizobium sp. ORS 375]|uniref:hypothetical protein n=1 Tax=Bradyrhizobium sp. (strain ORS 375) TaxID=566679 RepID=UPI0011127EFB|nr:hypothetical protein [Bradyrhizobium sp. ORS 375]